MSLFEFVRKLTWVFGGRFFIRRDNGPIDSIDALEYFVSTRASFVTQKILYGYLKARMGTRYPSMFEDDVFVHSINIAKFEVFAASLSDLTVFAVAHALVDKPDDDAARRKLALRCFANGLAENAAEAPAEFSPRAGTEKFTQRIAATDWNNVALTRENFVESPPALFHWAPISPELKKHDTDIVANSINFAWHEVRQNYTRRLATAAVANDWEKHGNDPGAGELSQDPNTV